MKGIYSTNNSTLDIVCLSWIEAAVTVEEWYHKKESSNVKDYVQLSVLDGIKQSQSIVQTGRNRNLKLVLEL